MAHWLTNRGKLHLLQGEWDDAGATDIRVGLLSNGTGTVPTGMDTEAEVQDLNMLDELLAITSVDEPAVGGYARQNLTRSNATEDDTNNRVNMDASDVVFTALVAGTTIYGGFVYDEGGGTDATRPLLSVFTFAAGVPTNGSDVTLTIADLYRAS